MRGFWERAVGPSVDRFYCVYLEFANSLILIDRLGHPWTQAGPAASLEMCLQASSRSAPWARWRQAGVHCASEPSGQSWTPFAYDNSLGFMVTFMPRRAEAPRAPRDSDEALRDPLANDGYYYLQSQLSNGLAQGPDALSLRERCSERVEVHTRGSHQLYLRGVASHHTLVGRAGLRPLEERRRLEPVLLPPSGFA